MQSSKLNQNEVTSVVVIWSYAFFVSNCDVSWLIVMVSQDLLIWVSLDNVKFSFWQISGIDLFVTVHNFVTGAILPPPPKKKGFRRLQLKHCSGLLCTAKEAELYTAPLSKVWVELLCRLKMHDAWVRYLKENKFKVLSIKFIILKPFFGIQKLQKKVNSKNAAIFPENLVYLRN